MRNEIAEAVETGRIITRDETAETVGTTGIVGIVERVEHIDIIGMVEGIDEIVTGL